MGAQIPQIARRLQAHSLIAGVLLILGLGGCSGNGDNSSVAQPLVGHAGAMTLHGRFVGTVKIDGVDYFGDAIVAPDGRTYVYIGDPHADINSIQMTSPQSSIHFVGTVVTRGSELTGPGRVIKPSSASSASIRLDRSNSGESGTVYGEISVNHEVWLLDLIPWTDSYNQPARLSDLQGLFSEVVAPFADGNMIVRIDPDGRAFFQGIFWCIGNGTFSPHGDGDFNVFDVEMSIGSCDGKVPNGEYQGLATLSPSNIQGTDVNLRVWLGRFSPGSAAVTMWGKRI